MPNYEVILRAPAINEVVVTTADNEHQAIERAATSAIMRMIDKGSASARVIPFPPSVPPA